jgi:hypothetical protein
VLEIVGEFVRVFVRVDGRAGTHTIYIVTQSNVGQEVTVILFSQTSIGPSALTNMGCSSGIRTPLSCIYRDLSLTDIFESRCFHSYCICPVVTEIVPC